MHTHANMHTSAHINIPKDNKHTRCKMFSLNHADFIAPFIQWEEKRYEIMLLCVQFSFFISLPETKPDIWACNETFYANCICLWAN